MSKPKSYIDKILLNPNKHNRFSKMKPAVKDNNFYFGNCISFNLVENLTQFKNKEITTNNLNLRLLGNLSFLFTKKKITIKKNKSKEKLNTNNNKKNNKDKDKQKEKEKEKNNFKILDEYECYVPTRRIPCLNKKVGNDKIIIKKENNKIVKKIHKEIKLPSNIKSMNFFRPEGRIFSHPSKNILKKISSLNVTTTSDGYSEALSSSNAYTNTNFDDVNDINNLSEDFSLICGESNDNIFTEKEFINLLRTSPTFPKYSELSELIECPLEDAYTPQMKYKNFVKILDEFINSDNNDDYSDSKINNDEDNYGYNSKSTNNNITINSNQESLIINISEEVNNNINNNQKVFFTNPANYKPIVSNTDKVKNLRKTSKSGKLLKVNPNIFTSHNSSIINKTSISDDNEDFDNYKKDESLFAFFENDENDKNNPLKKIDSKIRKILPKSAVNYVNKMSNQYIYLMYEKYKIFESSIDEAKNFIFDDIILKKLFVQLLKEFLLNIGISTKKFYDKIIKFENYSKEKFSFEHFMKIFDIILMEKSKDNRRFKFLLLFKIITQNDNNDQLLVEKQMNIFFDLIDCESIYIHQFCEIMRERLILRYKAIYINENIDKSFLEKYYIYRKIKIILDSFLNVLDS